MYTFPVALVSKSANMVREQTLDLIYQNTRVGNENAHCTQLNKNKK